MSILGVWRFTGKHPLTRSDRVGAFGRFLKWQIASRLVPGAFVFEWIKGTKFYVRSGETGLTGNIYSGLHEFPEMGYLLHVLRKNEVFVDVGSNVGSYTILACGAVGAQGVAIEPVPTTYNRLLENIRLNHLENSVRCLNIGVGKENAEVAFTGEFDTTNHVVAPSESSLGSIPVRIFRLDEALAQVAKDGLWGPAVMKMDVEGYEMPALEGAQATLRNPKLHSVIMELNGAGNRYGYDESRIPEMMCELGFRTYSYDPLTRTLSPLSGKNPSSDNILFIRDLALVSERLKNAEPVSLFDRKF